MKNRLKTELDVNKTDNKPTILKNWEKKLFDMMEGESKPTINRMPGKHNFDIENFIWIGTSSLVLYSAT
mgnify:CR=1 FL=1